jgi:hypothetical protein
MRGAVADGAQRRGWSRKLEPAARLGSDLNRLVARTSKVERDWLIAAGNPPHGICLTDAARMWTMRLVK